MLRYKDVPKEDMTEVVRVASELYDRDRTVSAQEAAAEAERRATAQAVEEVGIPAEYLDRAAAEVQSRRAAQIIARRKRNRILGGGAVALAAIAGIGAVALRPGPAPVTIPMAQAYAEYNPATQAQIGNVAKGNTIQIPGFVEERGKYKANLTVKAPTNVSLAGYRNVTFTVRSSGIPNTKLFFENGPTERWRSDNLALTGGEQTFTLPLDRMIHQTRANEKADWSGGRQGNPGKVQTISFKFGEKINPPSVSGEVTISDLQFQ